jgi:hypothetical protein
MFFLFAYLVFSAIIRLLFIEEIAEISELVESTPGRLLFLLCIIPWIGDLGLIMAAIWGGFNWAMAGGSLDHEADE